MKYDLVYSFLTGDDKRSTSSTVMKKVKRISFIGGCFLCHVLTCRVSCYRLRSFRTSSIHTGPTCFVEAFTGFRELSSTPILFPSQPHRPVLRHDRAGGATVAPDETRRNDRNCLASTRVCFF